VPGRLLATGSLALALVVAGCGGGSKSGGGSGGDHPLGTRVVMQTTNPGDWPFTSSMGWVTLSFLLCHPKPETAGLVLADE
jgi:hypothetical protein